MVRFLPKMNFRLLRKGQKIFAVFFVAVWLIASAFSVKAVTIDELEVQFKQIEQKTRELEKQAEQYRSIITEKLTQIHSLEELIALLNSQINEVQNDILLSQERIKGKNIQIEKLNLQLAVLEERVSLKKTLMGELLNFIYQEQDSATLLKLLLSDKNLSDIFDQQAQSLALQERLQDSLAEIRQEKSKLAIVRQEVETELAALLELEAQLKEQRKLLAERNNAKKEILRETKGEEKQYRRLLSEAEEARRLFLKELQEIEVEIERRRNFLVFVESGSIPPAGTRLLRWPEDDPVLTQGYGMTSYAKTGAYGGKGHSGLDMSAGYGSPVRAAADGTVLAIGREDCYNFRDRSCNGYWGNWIAIEHEGGLVTLYAHLKDKPKLAVGAKVSVGDIIAQEGSSGNSTGSHLHFSLYYKFFTFERKGWLLFNYIDGTLDPKSYL